MKRLTLAAAGLTAGAALLAPTTGSALPLAAPGAVSTADKMIVQAQSSRHYRRHGHRHVYRHRGWNNGAVIGGAAALGILGAAAAASAYPYGGGGYGCYIEQRPVHDQWGRYVGVQNVQVCP